MEITKIKDENSSSSSVPENQSALTAFRSDEALVAWIDILGASSLSDDRLEEVSNFLSHITAYVSGNSQVLQVKGDKKVNSILIGDAVCITQTVEAQANRSAVVTVAIQLSKSLLGLKLPHRGVVVQGPVRCGPAYSNMKGGTYITGRGVISAFKLEQQLKTVGLAINSDLLSESVQWSDVWTKEPVRTLGPLNEQYFVTNKDHLRLWTEFVEATWGEHPYSASAKGLLDGQIT